MIDTLWTILQLYRYTCTTLVRDGMRNKCYKSSLHSLVCSSTQ